MGDFRAELTALVDAYDEHGGRWPQADEEALLQAVEHARAVLAAAPQIEAPGWCETDAEQYAWQAGWEARDDAMLQPSLPVATLPENAQVIEPANRTILVPVPTPIPVSERLPGPEDCVPHPRTKRGNWCWGFERCEVSLARPARWRLMHMEAVEMEASHWLPAHALPLPEFDHE